MSTTLRSQIAQSSSLLGKVYCTRVMNRVTSSRVPFAHIRGVRDTQITEIGKNASEFWIAYPPGQQRASRGLCASGKFVSLRRAAQHNKHT